MSDEAEDTIEADWKAGDAKAVAATLGSFAKWVEGTNKKTDGEVRIEVVEDD